MHIEAQKKVTGDRPLSVVDKEDGMKLSTYEIIFFYLQIKPEYFARLMGKYGNDVNGKV